jgi:hypothetical protein
MPGSHPVGEGSFELLKARPERQPPRAQHFQHQFLFALPEDRLGERDRIRIGVAHAVGSAPVAAPGCRR